MLPNQPVCLLDLKRLFKAKLNPVWASIARLALNGDNHSLELDLLLKL